MPDQPNDAVTNAADLMINYTDDEIKAEVWAHIREIVREEVRAAVRNHMADPSVGERLFVNHAFMFNKQVLRAMKEFFANNNQIY